MPKIISVRDEILQHLSVIGCFNEETANGFPSNSCHGHWFQLIFQPVSVYNDKFHYHWEPEWAELSYNDFVDWLTMRMKIVVFLILVKYFFID